MPSRTGDLAAPLALDSAFAYTVAASDGSGNVGIASVTAVSGGVTAIDVEICATVAGGGAHVTHAGGPGHQGSRFVDEFDFS